MRILILTQVVDRDDFALGFFHRWIEEFARQCEAVTVICLKEGRHGLPSNVRVLSLGKESGVGRFGYLRRFYTYIWRERSKYDAVFVHMNPEYVLLGAPVWAVLRKPVTLWYTHGSVTRKLRAAVILGDATFTASADSLRIDTPKRVIVGHGIDLDAFSPAADAVPTSERGVQGSALLILTAGRISRTKNLHILIEAIASLRDRGTDARLKVVGDAITDADRAYRSELDDLVGARDLRTVVDFAGPVSNLAMPAELRAANAFVNLSDTGSIDKAVLEALACDVPVVTSNAAFADIVPGGVVPVEARAVSDRIATVLREPRQSTRALVRGYSIQELVAKVLSKMKSLCAL